MSDKQEIMNLINEYTLSLGAGDLVEVKGQGTRVWDIEGNEYLDFEGGPGVLNFGHCHPRLVKVIQEQAAEMTQTSGTVASVPCAMLAKKLAEITPGDLKRSFFCNSGAEAVDGAIKVVFKKASSQGRSEFGIMALRNAFHGRLSLPLSLTGLNGRKKGFGPYASFPGVVHVTPPYCYRCKLKHPECGCACAESLQDNLNLSGPGGFVAFISELVPCTGGILVPPAGYWKRVQEICKENNIYFIDDEVFCGFGRTGKMFAADLWDVKPDVMATAKAVGGGLPMAATIATDEVACAMRPRDHFTTYGWNNLLGMKAGLEAISVIEDENLVENSRVQGEKLLAAFRDMMDRCDVIGDVRGVGLMLGIEIVEDKASKLPNKALTNQITKALLQRRMIISTAGNAGNILRFTPPLIINDEDVELALATVKAAFADAGHPIR